MLKGIRNIIFDLGGVLLNIDPQKTIDAFAALGMEQLINDRGLSYDHEIFYQMEQGKISSEEFRNGVRKLLPRTVSDDQIDDAWTAMLLDFPPIRVQLLKNLRKEFRIFLFSNTNAIHVAKYHANFRNQYGVEVPSLFEKDFYSNEIGYRKPSPESFQEIIKLSGIDAAVASGLKGYWLEPVQSVEILFQEYL